MNKIANRVTERINANGVHDSKSATTLVAGFAGQLFQEIWKFLDNAHFGVESETCFYMTRNLREVWRPDLDKEDFIPLVPKTLSEETVNWCMSVLLL